MDVRMCHDNRDILYRPNPGKIILVKDSVTKLFSHKVDMGEP